MENRGALTREHGAHLLVNSIRTWHLVRGRGHPLVLLHGSSPGAASLVSWQRNIEPLAAAGFTVYAYDQPGCGYSDPPADCSVEYLVAHARAYLDALELPRFHLVGNSAGGYLAARVALTDERVGGYVTTATGMLAPPGSDTSAAQQRQHVRELADYTPSLANVRSMTAKTLYHQALVTDELVEQRYALSLGRNLEVLRARLAAGLPRPIWPELDRLRAGALLLWGRNDAGVSVERGVLLLERLPGAELHVFDQCAHWVQWDQAARFNTLVADYLHARERALGWPDPAPVSGQALAHTAPPRAGS